MSFIFCSSGAIVIKAGSAVSASAAASAAILAQYSNDAEGFICGTIQRDLITNYASVSSWAKLILADCASNHAASSLIEYDMSGYTSRAEAQTMLDILDNKIRQDLKLLEDKNVIGA